MFAHRILFSWTLTRSKRVLSSNEAGLRALEAARLLNDSDVNQLPHLFVEQRKQQKELQSVRLLLHGPCLLLRFMPKLGPLSQSFVRHVRNGRLVRSPAEASVVISWCRGACGA